MAVSIQNELNIRDVKTEHKYIAMEVWSNGMKSGQHKYWDCIFTGNTVI